MNTPCPYFNQGICRSCEWIDATVSEQLTRKERMLRERLQAFGDFELLKTVSGKAFGFRNKAKMTVTGTAAEPKIGIVAQENLDQGKEILDCPVHHPHLNQALHELKSFISLAKIEPYQISSQKGELKGVILFYSEHSQELSVRFVLRSKEAVSRIKKHAPALMVNLPQLRSISANLQPVPHAILEGREEFLLAGKSSITHRLRTRIRAKRQGSDISEYLDLELAPRAFVQTNQSIAEALYQTAAVWVREIGVRKFTELFCGQGAFSFFVKDAVHEGLGIEINPDAVQAANATAKREGAPHLKFVAADTAGVEALLDAFQPDILLVNPPRKGLGAALLYIQNKAYPHLIYSSCSLESLAQDLAKLPQYQIKRVQIFDLFPHTKHFEILVQLTHKPL